MAKKKSSGGGLFWVIIIVCIIVAMRGIWDDEPERNNKEFKFPMETEFDMETPGDSSELVDLGDVSRRMYKLLDSTEQMIYKTAVDTVSKGGLYFEVDNIDCDTVADSAIRALDAMYYDYPEFFWLNSGWSGETVKHNLLTGEGKLTVNLGCYDYWNYVTNPDEYINSVMTEARRIATMASKYSTEYEQVKFVHDYLVTGVVYDNVCVSELNQTVQRASSQQSHTVFGCLVSKLAVCDGYAKTFQLIMNLLGINSEYVEGDAGGGHAWNYIVLDGEAYWMDVTWDDHNRTNDDGSMKYPAGVDYGYFCITSNELALTHTVRETFPVPYCTATEYNFFRMEDCYLETYTFDDYARAVAGQEGSQIVSVKFATAAELERARDDLISNSRILGIEAFVGVGEITAFSDTVHNILGIAIE